MFTACHGGATCCVPALTHGNQGPGIGNAELRQGGDGAREIGQGSAAGRAGGEGGRVQPATHRRR